ncbi:2-oxo acid dehydrogenase subunit E2 [Salsuginibacillus kocurii]|uniref:2-oxo acid dehydrogenase subunit E2 n=1 Tax=Salsuginibacillus kocurii TaxID=427078 RepID=UPI00035E7A4B|nr:2-oxo acid dehydrogenase subunit E2 [Salsuginibacillus kocurii]
MIEVKLHDIGEGMHEAEILHFFVKPGDTIKNDEPLVEVQTDKMNAELPAPSAGIIKEINAEIGDVVEVGETILSIDNGSEQGRTHKEKEQAGVAASAATIEADSPPAMTQMVTPPRKNRVLAAPFTRKIARDHQVDIEEIEGSGPAGRVVDQDVYDYIDQQLNQPSTSTQTPANQVSEPATSAAERSPAEPAGTTAVEPQSAGGSFSLLSHFSYFTEADVTPLLALKEKLHEEHGLELSVQSFFIKALQITSNRYPALQSKQHSSGEENASCQPVTVGLMTEVGDNIKLPVLKEVQNMSISMINRKLEAASNQAKTEEVEESKHITFAINNVDPEHSPASPALLGYAKGKVISFHPIKEKPAVHQGEIKIRRLMDITLTFDQRQTSGSEASTAVNYFVQLIEDPNLLLVELM